MSTTRRDDQYSAGYLDGLDDGRHRANFDLVLITIMATLVALVAILAVAFHV